ncbi:hypothetical protein [Streptomyces canus]|uniref:hypothetical protein n=1 Tax=Streptomyces canus TaxID=58343 RepID=UPI0030E4903A
MSTNVVLDADVKARAACAVQLRYRTLGGLRPTATGLGATPDERPVAAWGAVIGPSRRGMRRTARPGAGCGERPVAARGAVIGPVLARDAANGPSRRGVPRTARRGTGDCNSPGARGTARPATTHPQPPDNRPGTARHGTAKAWAAKEVADPWA